jgi:hypothetical protein
MIEAEKSGKPGVTIVSKGFQADAEASARAFGMPGAPYLVVPEVLTGESPERIRKFTDDVFTDAVRILTGDLEDGNPSIQIEIPPTRLLEFTGEDRYAAFEEMNQAFLGKGWTDGFPLIPATEERVAHMLSGAKREPQQLLGVMPPGNTKATVEKIATNAVMAGCKPEHLPVLLAAVEAMIALGPRARGMLMSTGPHTPLMVINGPIRHELGVNCGRAALGPGSQSHVNVVLGRALRLVIMNVGHAYPGKLDLDTQGTPRKFSYCIGENEEENPWESLHVEQGFSPDKSTVSIFSILDELANEDLFNWTATGVMDEFVSLASVPTHHHWPQGGPFDIRASNGRLLLMSPDHAQSVAREGWTKQDVKDYMHYHSRVRAKQVLNTLGRIPEKVLPGWKWLLELSPEEQESTLLPVCSSSDDFSVVVLGGPAGKSQLLRMVPVGSKLLSTVEIKR